MARYYRSADQMAGVGIVRFACWQIRDVGGEQQLDVGVEEIKDQMAAGHEMPMDTA
jgi:hypothetical protein